MKCKRVVFIVVCVLFSVGINAQEIITSKKLGAFGEMPFRNLDEVNALVFKPADHDSIINPLLPDSLSSLAMLSKKERAEMFQKRYRFNPYLVFFEVPALKKGDIFIGFSESWIRLSSYYKYNKDSSSVEEFRKKANQNLLGKNHISYNQNFELLEDVNGMSSELLNADTVHIYDTKLKYKFKDTVDNYGSFMVQLVKFDLGYVSLWYYYPLDKREMALSEINNSWGVIQFKPDKAFTHPNRYNRTPPPTEPDLYFGKFSFLNDPEQVKREEEKYEQRKLKTKANSMAMIAGRLYQAKDFDQAKKKLFEVLAFDATNATAYRYLLLMSMDENNREESWKYWNKLAENDPKNNGTWFLKGLLERKFKEWDSATETFEMIVREKDSLNFKCYIELAFISIEQGDIDAADLNFNRAISVITNEGKKSLLRKTHRMFNINDLLMARLVYTKFLNTQSKFEKSKRLLEQTLEEEEVAIEASKKGERQSIYGKLTPANLGELNFVLARCYAGLRDGVNAKFYLEKAKDFGKVLPDELDRLLDN